MTPAMDETMQMTIAMTVMQKAPEDMHKTQKQEFQNIQRVYQEALETHEQARITNMKYESAFDEAKAAQQQAEYAKDNFWETQQALKESQKNVQELATHVDILKYELRQDKQTQNNDFEDYKQVQKLILLLQEEALKPSAPQHAQEQLQQAWDQYQLAKKNTQESQTKAQDTKNHLDLLNKEMDQTNREIQDTEQLEKKLLTKMEKTLKDAHDAREKFYELSTHSAQMMMMKTHHASEMAQNNAMESKKLIESKQLNVYRTMADAFDAMQAVQLMRNQPQGQVTHEAQATQNQSQRQITHTKAQKRAQKRIRNRTQNQAQ